MIPRLSLVIPMHNEWPVLAVLESRLNTVLKTIDLPVEIICVDDGSRDETWAGLLAWQQRDDRLRLVRLSRNFGHEAAILAGLKQAKGDAIITMDADLQDPPELIPALLSQWDNGFDVVYAVRVDRTVDSWMKRTTASLFYKLAAKILPFTLPENAGQYRLIDRKVIDVIINLPESNRFLRALTSWAGFRQGRVCYHREDRVAGQSKYNYWRMWNYALDAITGFSHLPLRIWSYVGVFVSLCAFVYALVILVLYFLVGRETPGWASLMIAVLFLGGIQLICLGIIGEYLGRIFMEVKGRPMYIVSEVRDGIPVQEDSTHAS
jgi:glycosyltransferase involved in cell wall biosynthesis